MSDSTAQGSTGQSGPKSSKVEREPDDALMIPNTSTSVPGAGTESGSYDIFEKSEQRILKK